MRGAELVTHSSWYRAFFFFHQFLRLRVGIISTYNIVGTKRIENGNLITTSIFHSWRIPPPPLVLLAHQSLLSLPGLGTGVREVVFVRILTDPSSLYPSIIFAHLDIYLSIIPCDENSQSGEMFDHLIRNGQYR